MANRKREYAEQLVSFWHKYRDHEASKKRLDAAGTDEALIALTETEMGDLQGIQDIIFDLKRIVGDRDYTNTDELRSELDLVESFISFCAESLGLDAEVVEFGDQ